MTPASFGINNLSRTSFQQVYQEVKKKESKNKREDKKGLKNKKEEKKELNDTAN